MIVNRSYSVSLNNKQKEEITDLLIERDNAKVWSEDIIYKHIESLLSDAFLMGLNESK